MELGRPKGVWIVVPSGCSGGKVVKVKMNGGGLGKRRGQKRRCILNLHQFATCTL